MSPNTTPRAATVSFAVRLRSARCGIASTAIVRGLRLSHRAGWHGGRVLRRVGTGSTRFLWNPYDGQVRNKIPMEFLYACNGPPPPHGHQAPDALHKPERPCALQEAVSGAQPAGRGEREDEPGTAILQGVEDQHRRDREQSKGCEGVQPYLTIFADVGGCESSARSSAAWSAGRSFR